MAAPRQIPTQAELLAAGATEEEASRLRWALQNLRGSPDQVWRRICSDVLHPDQPFELHKIALRSVHAEALRQAESNGPPALWVPTEESAAETNLAKFMETFEGDESWRANCTGSPLHDFPSLQMLSFDSPEVFWPPMLEQLKIRFHHSPSRILDTGDGSPDSIRWLPGAVLNIAESCLVGRDPYSPAVVWATEGSPRDIHYVSYGQLHQQVCSVAASLRSLGFQPGEAVAICMPMTATTVALYLGIIWAGCSVVSIADSFAQDAVASRLKVSSAVAMFTQDVIRRGRKKLPLYTKLAGLPLQRGVIVIPASAAVGIEANLGLGDMSWAQFVAADLSKGLQLVPPHYCDAYTTTNILFSSGTTGEPKAIPWTHVTPIRAGLEGWGHQDIRTGDVVVWPTNIGWMMGPWLIYASLLNGAAVGIYEGSPLERGFGEFVSCARVTMLGLVPSIVKIWRSAECMKGLDWGSIRCFSSTGEASNSDDYHWLMARAGYKPVVELCGGTEIGGGFLAGSLLLPSRPGAFSTPTLGSRIVILSGEDGDPDRAQSPHSPLAHPTTGELAIMPPMLGISQRLMNRDHHKVYYYGMPHLTDGSGVQLRRHGDVVSRLGGSVYCAQGRSDDTMNLGGIKVSSVEIERACMAAGAAGVVEVAAVGVAGPRGGAEALVIFVVPSSGSDPACIATPEQLVTAFTGALKENLNPLFKVSQVVMVQSLPRTASNKVMRRLLRGQLQGPAASKL